MRKRGLRVRRLKVRRLVDRTLDQLRYRLDTFPRLPYQPLPQVGIAHALRDEGVFSRWAAMAEVLDELQPRTALDLGSQVGFFTLQLAERQIPTVAVEMEPRHYRILLAALRRLKLTHVGVLAMEFTPRTAPLLPSTDAVVFLSVWHHLVRWHGEDQARAMLRVVWSRTQQVLFFETGENEMPARYHLPDMGADPRAWLTGMLEQECAGGTVGFLGRHSAFDPDDRPYDRHVFAVVRPS